MTGPLLSLAELGVRLGRALADAEAEQARTLIDDATALAYDIAGAAYAGDLSGSPAVLAVAAQMVTRALDNPRGLTGEGIGDYNWQANNSASAGAGIYATPAERRIIRRAAGRSSVAALSLEGDLPLPVNYAGLLEL